MASDLPEDEISEADSESSAQADIAEDDDSEPADDGEDPEEGTQEDPDTGSEEDPEESTEEDAEGGDRENSQSGQESAGSEKPEGKKGFFSRIKDKKDKKDTQIEELTDRVKRQMAEFDNYRKRTEKEKAAMFEIGAKSVIEKILPVVDNFERGLDLAADPDDPYVQGMQKVYKQLTGVLEGLDVKPIEAVGKEYDPNFHNAVMHVEDDQVGENIVVEELQKGYLYRGSVVRYSMVKVAN
ncbi:MAG: nucleotide exchange factor GrpE [Lachnospiraceae bacterium]|nr:nucleotide exchange factor GrpE [Lachnospiraceae bacterium]